MASPLDGTSLLIDSAVGLRVAAEYLSHVIDAKNQAICNLSKLIVIGYYVKNINKSLNEQQKALVLEWASIEALSHIKIIQASDAHLKSAAIGAQLLTLIHGRAHQLLFRH